MNHWVDLFLNKQRKLLVTGVTGLAIVGGFVFVAFKPLALDAYKVAAEWLVYLSVAYNGGNALTYWAQRGTPAGGTPAAGSSTTTTATTTTTKAEKASVPAGAAKP